MEAVRTCQVVAMAENGVSTNSFRANVFTMEGDRYLCIKDQAADGSAQVVTVDMHNNNSITRKPMKADGALMALSQNVIALKGRNDDGPGHFIQVYNLDTKDKLGVHKFTEAVVFWRWLSDTKLAVITDTSVFHWTLVSGQTVEPTKVFGRGGKLAEASTQIINYALSGDEKWCLLTGITKSESGQGIDGHLQLFSVERNLQQFLEGHAGCFATIPLADGKPAGVLCFMERKAGTLSSTLHIMDISRQRVEGQPPPFKVKNDVQFSPDSPSDFAVHMHLSPQHGVVQMVTKAGFLFLFDTMCAATLLRTRISQEGVFTACASTRTGGLFVATRAGVVLSTSVNEAVLVQYVQQQLVHLANRADIAFNLAARFGLPGAEELMSQQFGRLFAAGDYKGSALIAAKSTGNAMRNANTIQQFKNAPAQPGQSSPILQYFSTLLEHGRLQSFEAVELVKPVAVQGRKDFVEQWLREDKLECSEELGDVIKGLDSKMALDVYVKCNAHQKVINCMVEIGQCTQVVDYAKQHNVDVRQVVELLVQQGKLPEVTSILVEFLKDDKPEQADLQTRVLELNLLQAPQVASAIFQRELFTHYNKPYIAQLCEKAGMHDRALEHYQDAKDIKRVLAHSHSMNPEFLVNYFHKMSPDTCLECLADLLKSNRQNMQAVVQVAVKEHEHIGALKLVAMFEQFNSSEGIFYFLGSILQSSTDPDIHFRYLQAAARLNHIPEVERVCRESTVYDPVKVKDFLKEAKLSDPRPLIYVCDLHGYVPELTEYLYKNSLLKYIEVYAVKVNSHNAPLVVGTLIDLDCSEDFIKNLLQNVRAQCPVEPLVEEVEKRNRLRLLLPWLEARLNEGCQEPPLHNALAKIYIDTNRDPEVFLKNNALYDSVVVGKYCEERDPHLAFTVYKRAWGTCDDQLVDVTNRNGLFRLQARYLVERQNLELWAKVLDPNNQHRRSVIDQVVSTALAESTVAEEVSVTVKAFIDAQLPNELIELLEKIVLHNSDFSGHENLQNLLMITAMRADRARVMDYVNRLDKYNGPEMAKVALGKYQLYEEAFLIYKKCGQMADAIEVLLTNMESLERAAEFAARCNEPACWYRLGKAQLENHQVGDAIDSYLKSENPADYMEVIEAAQREDCFDELQRFLQMARTKVKDQHIDSELLYSMAKMEQLEAVETFLSTTSTANVQLVGDRLFDEQHFKAAKLLFASIPNNARLASCHVQLGEFQAAVDAAKKANNPKTWKELNTACVAAKEFKCAQIAGMSIIVHPDHLEELAMHYEREGHFTELLALLETGLSSDRAHSGMYTELAVLYAKYTPDKLMDFIKANTARLNIPRLTRACERHCHWPEAVILQTSYQEWDAACNTMMLHSPTAFAHDQFVSAMKNVVNTEMFSRAVSFYIEEQPLQLPSLLSAIVTKVDHARVVQQLRQAGLLGLSLPYLKQVQSLNLQAVNDALNELYVETEDCMALRASIEEFDNVDPIALAQRLEGHNLLEMRRVSALLYKKNKRYKQSMDVSKADAMFQDAMETAADSRTSDLAESLIRFFVERKDKECFAACLYTCYDLLRPDVVLELAWKGGMTDFAMPYLIQVMREYTGRLDGLDKKTLKKEQDEERAKSAPNDYDQTMMGMGGAGYVPQVPGLGGLALMPPPGPPMAYN